MRVLLLVLLHAGLLIGTVAAEAPWRRHVIDDSLRGADGVRLGDIDGDGLTDVVTGWEESGVVRLYAHPGYERVQEPWPHVTVGESASPEDAVPIDFDRDGRLDIVSCHEGRQRSVFVHWNEANLGNDSAAERQASLLRSTRWKTQEVEPLQGEMWMFATPLEIASRQTALVVGSKGANGSITLVVLDQEHPRSLDGVQIIRLREAGWIMSLVAMDMDGDGDEDIVYSDRKGNRRGVGWLEHPDHKPLAVRWADHSIGGEDQEVMFVDARPSQVLVATRSGRWLEFDRRTRDAWSRFERSNPPNVTYGKAIRRLPSSGEDGSVAGVILTANTHAIAAERQQPALWWLPAGGEMEPIDSPPGGKFDRIECLDLDGDGDADVLTCEERKNLGLVWYENPGF